MNIPVQLISSLVPIIAELLRDDINEDAVLTKTIRFAERAVVGSKKGKQRLDLVLAILRGARPTMLSTAARLDKLQRKISVIVIMLKDVDANDTGLDDLVADKLAQVATWVDHLGDWVERAAKRIPQEEQNTDEVFMLLED